ncbi:MAG: UDP-N-acetylmuramate dehydrogenase [Deltaproteobacteria bacterium]|nr:UDP-N-acetylmuramate dehydrogenase [Deltaproteobacteria bacterium]
MSEIRHASTPTLQHSSEFFMVESGLAEQLNQIPGLKVKINEPLARYTSMKIGGPADYYIEAEHDGALRQLLPLLERHGAPICLLGNGSNVLVSDRGVRGAVIHLAGVFKRVEWVEDETGIWANVGAAHAVTQLVREAARRGYAELEFAEGIPGTMGGALVMNAGAYGSEFEKIVDVVDGVTREGKAARLTRPQINFTYRDSNLPPGMVVTRVRLRLSKAESVKVSSTVRELVTRRKSSQPSGHPNSGSMFRNPPGDFAGRLIEAAGLKGKRIGQAQISERHANFIVNLGGANAEDVRNLMDRARVEVKQRFGVELASEVKYLGDWPAK